MRKSSLGGRPSISGAPVRVLGDIPNKARSSTSSDDRFSLGGRSSIAGSKLPVFNQHKSVSTSSNAFSFLPKTGRPSSGIGVRVRTDVPKDPRPISEKKFQIQCIKQLMEFLIASSYPHPISQKLLTSPSSKDFFKIFEFIFSKFWKGYKQVPKMEEEVPRVLKLLGYPFALSKTYLFSAGSPHTWPHLLAALIWMIDLLQMTNSISELGDTDAFIFESEDDNFDGISEGKIIFDYCNKTYAAFMSGQDTFEKFDEELEQCLKEKHQIGTVKDLTAENERLKQEVDRLQHEDERVQKMQEGIEMSRHDAKVMQTYIDDLQQYKKVQEGLLQTRQDDCEMLLSDLQAEREKLSHMHEVYEQQDLTPADVERLRAEKDGLNQQMEQLEKQIADIDSDIWNANMEQAKLNEKVEKEVAMYNRQAIALKLVPETAELARGMDLKLRTGFNSDIFGDFENTIKPALASMKKQCTANLRQKSKEKFRLTCEMEQFQETLVEKKEAVTRLANELANQETSIESMKQMLQASKKTDQIEAVKRELAKHEASLKQTESKKTKLAEKSQAAKQLLASKKEDVERQVSEMEETKRLFREDFVCYFNDLIEQLSGYQNEVNKINSDLDLQTLQLKMESKERKKWTKSILNKDSTS